MPTRRGPGLRAAARRRAAAGPAEPWPESPDDPVAAAFAGAPRATMTDHAIAASGQGIARPAPLGGPAPERGRARRVSTRVLADVVCGLDALLLLLAGGAAGLLPAGRIDGRAALAAAAAAALAGFAVLLVRGDYSVPGLRGPALRARGVLVAAATAALAWGVVSSGIGGAPAAKPALLSALACGGAASGLLLAHRFAVRRCLDALERQGRLAERVALVGAAPDAARHLRALTAAGGDPVEIVGVFDHGAAGRDAPHPAAGTPDDLVDLSRRERVDVIVVAAAASGESDPAPGDLLARLGTTVADIAVVPAAGVGRAADGAVPTRAIGACPAAIVDGRPIRDWDAVLKDGFDRCAAAALLAGLATALAAIALAIKLDSPGPVFFRQKRRGFNDEVFMVFKFRTMHHAMRDPDADRLTSRDDPRVTRVGRWLRRLSLDELPQLLNVLRGEMSLVGPRPHPLGAKAGARPYAEVVRNYSRRHRVKPGITGWAQVNGWRGETTSEHQIEQRVSHDLHYIENWSFALDLKILLLTLRGGFRGEEVF